MLIYFTVLYFLILFFYYYKRNGFDISCCIVVMYLITSACGIFLMRIDKEFARINPSLLPTVVYCSMITLVSWPFYKFNSNRKRKLKPVNINAFNSLAWFFIVSFIFSLTLFYNDMIFRLSLGSEIGELRGNNVETAQARLPEPIKTLSTIAVSICSMSAVCFILFFYSVTFLHKPKWFNCLLLVSSLGCIISGIIGIDRSIVFYWVLNFFFIFILFKPYLSQKTRKSIKLFAIIVFCLVGAYFIMMTMSRFGDNAANSLLVYLGQNYLYFCWFWDNYDAPVMNWGIFMPVLSHFFIDWGYPVSAMPFGFFVQNKVGYFVNLFYTFMGTIMLYLGQWAVIPFCMIYTLIARTQLIGKRYIGIQNFIIIFILALVPYDGVILYTLVDYIKAFGIIFLLFYCSFLQRKNKYRYNIR